MVLEAGALNDSQNAQSLAPIKILLVTESSGWSGGAAQTLLLARGLAARKHGVWIACQRGSEIARRAESFGIPLLLTRIRGDLDVLAIWALLRFVRKKGIQILHAQHPKAHGVGLFATALASHSCSFLVTRRVSFPVGEHRFSRLKYTSSYVDRYLAVSDGVKQVLIQGGLEPSRVQVVYSGVETEDFRPSSPQQVESLRHALQLHPKVPTFIKVANYSQWKGQEVFLRAIQRYLSWGHPGQFIFAGRATDGPEMTGLVDSLGIRSSVRRLGFRTDVADLLAASDASVNSAIAGEGLSGALRESLLLGIPVVASDVAGNRELVQEGVTGKLVPVGDSESLAKALVWMIQNRDEARRLAEQGRQRVLTEFSADQMVHKTEQAYRELLTQKEGSSKR